jgi:hypothetical protein
LGLLLLLLLLTRLLPLSLLLGVIAASATYLNRRTTYRTCVMLLKPHGHTLAMKPMLARQNSDFILLVHLINADRAFSLAFGIKVLIL